MLLTEKHKEGMRLYEGNKVVVKGSRDCPQCGAVMRKKPLNHEYVINEEGILLVKPYAPNKLEVVIEEVDELWTCTNCVFAIRGKVIPKKRQ